jgi:hypothetical protein
MICKLCGSKNLKAIFKNKILDRYTIEYFLCNNCDYCQTEKPFWLGESYSDSINDSDIGYVHRNIRFSNQLWRFLISLQKGKKSKFLDYGAGYGLLVRLLRDNGINIFWNDLFTDNIFSKGFEFDLEENWFEAIISLEVFEHLEFPKDEIEKMLKHTDTLIFSTELHSFKDKIDTDWWYLGSDHGQHIGFLSYKAIKLFAARHNLNYSRSGKLHILSRTKISFFRLLQMTLVDIYFRLSRKLIPTKIWTDRHQVLND